MLKIQGFQNLINAADANPRLYDRLIAACSILIAVGLVAMTLLAVQPVGAASAGNSATIRHAATQ